MRNNKLTLLISSIILLPFTFSVFQVSSSLLSPQWGYLSGFIFYWVYALAFILYITGLNRAKWKSMLGGSKNHPRAFILQALAFVPVVGVFFISFLPNINQLSLSAAILLVVMAIVNGLIEEVYWRGLYLLEYKNDWRIGLLAATLLFAVWHISLWFSKGMLYQGGFGALVGGALIMGLLWAWVTRSVGNIRACVAAHILVNLFAFTALLVQNGF